MMRILNLAAGNLYGGVERFLVTLATEQRQSPASFRFEFALCFEGRLAAELRETGAQVHMLTPVRISNPRSILRARSRLSAILCAGGYDAAICHGAWIHVTLGPAVRRAGLTMVAWMHDASRGRHFLERLARATAPDLAICNSEWTAACVREVYPRWPQSIVRYPVALPPGPAHDGVTRAALRVEFATAPDSTVIVQVSRMEPWKGHRFLIAALSRMAANPRWTCWIVGGAQRRHEAVYRAALEAQAEAVGIGTRVRFTGERSDIGPILAAADIHCQPNLCPEPFGITFIEALYAGLPVVTSAIGGALEIVTPECGMLVEPGDEAGLADALGRLVDDPTMRARLGAAGPARARELCDPPVQLERIAEAIARIAGASEEVASACPSV